MLTKAELIDKISEDAGWHKTEAKEAYEVVMRAITEGIKEGGVPLTIGKLELSETTARTGRNPKTGEVIQIPAKKTVKFKPSSKLKETVNT